MKSVKLENILVQETTNNTYVVIADTERFGSSEILFESHNRQDCINYILRTASFLYQVTLDMSFLSIIIEWMGAHKNNVLRNACTRNSMLTSFYGLEHSYIYTTEEGGLYIHMTGTRCEFSVFVDEHGKVRRAPAKKTLHSFSSVSSSNFCSFMC